MRYESSSDDDEEEECGAPRCLVNNSDITEVKWIECDTCAVWFHVCCVGMADRSEFELQEVTFVRNVQEGQKTCEITITYLY